MESQLDASTSVGARRVGPVNFGLTRRARIRLTFNLTAVGFAGVALTAVAAAIATHSDLPANPTAAAIGRALMVAMPITVGLYAWHRRPDERFGPLLVAAGFGWFLTTLAESDDSLVYSVGRVSAWVVEIGLVWLILSFPSGRLTDRVDRMLVQATAALVAVLYVPTALLADAYSTPAPYTSCTDGCPDNAFFAFSSEPAIVDGFFVPVREVLTLVIFLAVTARIAQRVADASPLMRRTLTPVLLVAGVRVLLVAIGTGGRWVDPDSTFAEASSLVIALALPAMAAAFFIGLFQRRLYAADALQQLATQITGRSTPEEMRAALAAALQDPSLKIIYRVSSGRDRWVDAAGNTVEPPAPRSGLALSEIRDGNRIVAGIVHDAALSGQREFIQAVSSYALVALENRRLTAKVELSLREVRKSRARILASADRERRRLERDLHDGAQQRLVALRIQIELAEELVARDPERGIAKLHALGEDVGETLDQIRELAHGVYPSLLADRGLAEALRGVSQRLPVEFRLHAAEIGRHPAEVESAVYFCCLEAVQNATKHAADANLVEITLSDGDALRFEVRDDGAGFDGEVAEGAGLTNMRDRLAAVGGELEITSATGQGTVLTGTVPLRAH
ncbi:MAG: sensor histidine kinase [Thermoleophilaceae bacterium]